MDATLNVRAWTEQGPFKTISITLDCDGVPVGELEAYALDCAAWAMMLEKPDFKFTAFEII